jgi:hypothetical protein
MTMLTFPPRSELYPLEPIGVGSGLVQSLTDYVAQLAEEHSVGVGDLVGRVLSTVPNPHREIITSKARSVRENGHGYRVCTNAINGGTERVAAWVYALEVTTTITNLRCLSLLPFGSALTDDLFNTFRSWCPECLEEWRLKNQRVFEPLIWAFRAYSICPQHNRRLSHTCKCGRTLNPLGTFCRSCHCDHCGVWLGGFRMESGQTADGTVFSEDEKWASTQVVGLVEMLPWIDQDVARASLRQSMNVYLEKLTAGNLLAFAESIECPSSVLSNWLNGSTVPKFDNLLRTSRCLNVPASSLFTPDGPTTANIAAARDAVANRADRGVSPYRDCDTIRGALLASLRDDVPRTLSDVARGLGYTNTERLYQVDRSLCHDIAERYRRSGRSHAWKKPGASRICEVTQLKSVLVLQL